jgi:hypothetical protein
MDPLWVFRQDELDMIARWMCAAPEEETPEKTAPTSKSSKHAAPKE